MKRGHPLQKIAVIGAGLSGLNIAKTLKDKFDVDVFEKSSKPGGRIASRRTSSVTFDHGAQFFSVKSAAFARFIQPIKEAGVIVDWQARFVELDQERVISQRNWTSEFPHYVGYPSMSEIGKWLSTGLNIYYDFQVSKLEQQETGGWSVVSAEGKCLSVYDWVIFTAPVHQSIQLLPSEANFKTALAQIKMLPCYALMVKLVEPPEFDFDAALVKNTNISWISVNHTKPGRTGYSLVIHASNAWAAANIHRPLEHIREAMLSTVFEITGLKPETVEEAQVKKWLYANTSRQNGKRFFIDEKLKLAACGDWCIAGRIEAAFTSSSALAAYLSQGSD